MSSPFFINGNGKPLSHLKNTPGSLLSKIGQTVGVPDLTPTMLRYSLEKLIQSDEKMRNQSKSLNCHSEDVGRIIYHESSIVRSEFVNHTDYVEGSPAKKKAKLSVVDKKRQEEMDEMEEADEKARKLKAQEFMEITRAKRSANVRCGNRVKVQPNHLEFLQKLVLEKVFNNVYQHFPKGKFFSVLFKV